MKRKLPAMRLTIWKKLICVCALMHLTVSHLSASEEQEKPAQQGAGATKPSPYVENWTQWRGSRADGHAGERARPPIQWDKEKNIAWVAELPGEGSATPIVYGNQVFVLSAVKTERKSTTAVVNDERAKTTPDEMYYQFVVSSYDRRTGQVLWQRVATEQAPHECKHETNTYAAGSPTTDGHFYFTSREGTIVVVKDNETLEVVATNDLEDVIDASPVAVDNQLFVRSWNKLYCIEQMPAADSTSRSEATNTIFFNQSLGDEPAPGELHNTPWLTFPGGDGPGKGKRIVLISAEQEYRSEQSMPMMAKILSQHHGFDCTVLFGVNARGEVDPTMPVYPEKGKEAEFKEHHIPGLEHLASADLVIFFTRLLTLPPTEQQQIVDYIDSGKPLIALRTANHGFRGPLPYKINGKQVRWGEDILGGSFMNHHGRWHADSTRGFFDKDHAQHPILTGVTDIWGDSDVYRTYKEGTNLPAECTALVWGQPLMGRKPDDLPNDKLEPLPVAWVKPWQTSDGKTARVFHCTMGSGIDLKSPGLRRLVINSAYWCTGMEESISASRSVEIVGSYEPLESGFNYDELGVKPRPISFYR